MEILTTPLTMYNVCVQPSFEEVMNDVTEGVVQSGNFWVNLLRTEDLENGPVKEQIIQISKEEDDKIRFENFDGVKFEKTGGHKYTIEYEGMIADLISPIRKITSGVKRKELCAVGNENGDLNIMRMTDLQIERTIENAHFSEITKTLFFPSGKVVLTASLDFQIKIWDVASGLNPRTFSSHKGRITDIAMIERGRNFLSSSLDGTVKIWDCGSGTNYSTFSRKGSFKDGVTSLCLFAQDKHINNDPLSTPNNPYEFETEGKLVFAGHASGVISGFDLASRDQLLTLPSLDAEVIGLWSSCNTIVAGYSNGLVAKWDTRNRTDPLEKVQIGDNLKYMISDGYKVFSSYGYDSTIIGMQTDGFSKRKTVVFGIDDNVIDVTLSGGKLYACTSNSGEIYVYNTTV